MSLPPSRDAEPASLEFAGSSPTDLLKGDAPDWSIVAFEIHCPRCSYNLRGLSRPLCPECGFELDWLRLLKHRLAGGDFLFEHAWRRRPVNSLLRTIAAACRPWRFWERVDLYEPIYPRPLLLQLGLTILAAILSLHIVAFTIVQAGVTFFGARTWGFMGWGAGTRTSWRPINVSLEQLWLLAVWPMSLDQRYLYLPLGVILGTLGAGVVLYSLHQTLGRCRVRKVHILRVLAYSAPPILVTCAVCALAVVAAIPRGLFQDWMHFVPRPYALDELALWQIALMGACPIAMFLSPAVCLSIALHRYLRLPNATIVGFTTTAVAYLFAYSLLVVARRMIGS